jgi:epoxide hydrolase
VTPTDVIERFAIHVDDAAIADLDARLASTRFGDQLAGSGWELGVPNDYLRALAATWRDAFDWRAAEARLNSFDHFRTVIDDQSIHFVHARSPHAGARPLLLVHGWPGSIVEFLNVIPMLTDPERHGGDAGDAFHVIAPSLPGYAFSGPTVDRGWNSARIARAFAVLMDRLGYPAYGAQGGDWGAQVTTRLARVDATHCVGLHLNMPIAERPDRAAGPVELSADDQAGLAALGHFVSEESGYALEQSTKPHTIGAALADSPVGLLAWIVEKFRAWSDCDGDPEAVFARDDLLTNVAIYWFTDTITSSARLYWEHAHRNLDDPAEVGRVEVPTGVARFPKEVLRYPRPWVERAYNVTRWTEMPRGGHFAAMEQPHLFVNDVRAFFRTLP